MAFQGQMCQLLLKLLPFWQLHAPWLATDGWLAAAAETSILYPRVGPSMFCGWQHDRWRQSSVLVR